MRDTSQTGLVSFDYCLIDKRIALSPMSQKGKPVIACLMQEQE